MQDGWSGSFVEIGGRQMRWTTDLKSPSRIEPYYAYRSLGIFPSDRANVAEMIGICGLCACHNEGEAIEKVAPFFRSLVYEGVSQLAINPDLWSYSGYPAEIAKFRSLIGEGSHLDRHHHAKSILNFSQQPTNRFLLIANDMQPLPTNDLPEMIESAAFKSGVWIDIRAITREIISRHSGTFFEFHAD